jgi:ubiquinone/menaquinone biosynthesis C-methylase UbiE
MSDSDKLFAGSIPEFYDTLMVPLIFEPYAADLAGRVAALSPFAVLETAAGSGVVARALAARLPAGARYMVTDLNQPMLDYASGRQEPNEHIAWQQADALSLPFEDGAFDVVCCQFGVMFFPDKVTGYAEARRVLKPGGSFIFNVWDHIEVNVFAETVTDAVAEVFPDDPPRFLARIPHGDHDLASIEAEIGKAGFSGVSAVTIAEVSRADSTDLAATAFCQGTPLRNEIEARDATWLQFATNRAAEAIASRHDVGSGAVAGKMQAHVITAVA